MVRLEAHNSYLCFISKSKKCVKVKENKQIQNSLMMSSLLPKICDYLVSMHLWLLYIKVTAKSEAWTWVHAVTIYMVIYLVRKGKRDLINCPVQNFKSYLWWTLICTSQSVSRVFFLINLIFLKIKHFCSTHTQSHFFPQIIGLQEQFTLLHYSLQL